MFSLKFWFTIISNISIKFVGIKSVFKLKQSIIMQ